LRAPYRSVAIARFGWRRSGARESEPREGCSAADSFWEILFGGIGGGGWWRSRSVAWQLVESDFADFAADSFRSVVNNRPDDEAPDQLPNAQAEAAAQRHGLHFRFLPVNSVTVTNDGVVDTFASLTAELPRPDFILLPHRNALHDGLDSSLGRPVWRG